MQRPAVKNATADAPIAFDYLQQIKARFAELRGRKAIIASATIEATKMYAFNFSNEKIWRSFRLSTMKVSDNGVENLIFAYARKGSPIADKLLDLATSQTRVTNIVVRYPADCKENNIIELLSCDFPNGR